jgi:hypothetical protein
MSADNDVFYFSQLQVAFPENRRNYRAFAEYAESRSSSSASR